MRWLCGIMTLGFGNAIACEAPNTGSTRIAIAGGSLTEIVYFLGAQDRIVATDTTSVYPSQAQAFPSVGYVRNLSSEGVLSLRPTLVLGEHDMGPPEVLAQLARTGVAILNVPEQHTSEGIITKVRCVARALALTSVGEDRIATELEPTLASLRLLQAQPSSIRVAVLLGLRDGLPLAAGHGTSGDGFLKMIQVQNVFSEIDGWKPVSLEAMTLADPNVIIMPQRGVSAAGGIDAIAEHPAIRLTSAGRTKKIVSMDGMAMLGFGPRTLTAAIQVAESIRNPEIVMRATP